MLGFDTGIQACYKHRPEEEAITSEEGTVDIPQRTLMKNTEGIALTEPIL